MLTKATISGYKSLQDTVVRFAPFTVIVGLNNSGKSNLFDALRLLSHVAQMPVAGAFRPEHHRGDPMESFFSAERRLRLECDCDLSATPHPFHRDARLSHPFLRYEVWIAFEDGRLMIRSESLRGRMSQGDHWRAFISTTEAGDEVLVNRDTAQAGRVRRFPLPADRSVLTVIDDAELYPHIVALAEDLSAWRFFRFDPDVLREPSPAMDILELEPNGRGMSGFYDTLARRHPALFSSAERALSKRGLPETGHIRVLDTGDHRRLLSLVRKDGREFTARVLSDGTLRFLALLALAYAPNPPPLVCFEEPENGVPPARLPFIVDTLRAITERRARGGRRAQVLVNSHSPYLVDLLEPDEMLIARLDERGRTRFIAVEDLFANRPAIEEALENGERTLGEAWSEGWFDGRAT